MRKSFALLQLARHAQPPASLLNASLRRTFVHRLPRPTPRALPHTRGLATSPLGTTRAIRSWRAPFRKRWQTRPNSNQAAESQAAPPQSLSARMKEMSRKYGWTVTGIYLGLSVLDFPFCFLAVRMFGTERIAEIEHTIVDGFWSIVEKVVPTLKERRETQKATAIQDAESAAREASDAVAADAKHKDPGLGTQLLLAYGVHKSLIFFRIPLTLAITPKVVKTLRAWGWKIGKAKTA